MPGNKAIHQDAIKKGHNAAWDRQWAKAIAEYRRALAEFPDDVNSRLSLAHALEESGQIESALREYLHVSEKQPRDPVPRVHVAEMQVKLRRPGEAAATYLTIAEMYLKLQLKSKAIEAWNKAAELEPDRTDVHQKLAEMFEEGGQRAQAANEYLAIARIHKKRGDKDKVLNLAQRARGIDPRSAAARALIDEQTQAEVAAAEIAPSPVAQAQKEALSRLAETLLEDGRPERRAGDRPHLDQAKIDTLIARAVDAQMHHRVANAIESYRQLFAEGVTRAEVKFNLGLLYLESMRYDDAIKFLTEMVEDKNYGLASHFALGQCYRAQGKMDQAVEHFLQVTKSVDLGSVQREHADELISVYKELAESYAAKGDRARAESFSNALEKFLTDKGWEDKVHEVRRHLESLREEGGQVSLAEVIGVPDSAQVLEALARAQEYLRREKFLAASEECYRAIELAPSYLPGHVRLAEILARAGRTEDARDKYQTLAELSLARGDVPRAEMFYRSVLKIGGDDVGDRSKLIDLLIQQGRSNDALEQYLTLGESQVRRGDFGKAEETLAEGLRLAERSPAASPAAITLRHRRAEARARHGDFKGALAAYQEIRQHSPDDERAQFYAIDLQFRLGEASRALRDLEALLSRYQSRSEPQKATGVLEALAQSYPQETGLGSRLAQHYIALGAKDKAIATLDALGDVYLNAGQKQAAVETIRQILALDPPRAEEYQKLLEQMVE
ncbi:MAG: tetratricopeptide repeat protein [Chloroflexota bacterium]|nr:tetratricopeptide repeat protein [Chloroflexota bacterium]